MDSARPFRAFVSYCHADAAFAARLQRRLEAYRLPKRLADKVAPLPGQTPGRIGPIFRDRADLSAAEDLSAAVREAIAASSALVVVASPDAAGSRWVALEIRLFRELHPSGPVLVALARGEPEAALPEALRIEGVEPLAADFRREGDGKRLAFLKIVAGLTGIPFDALVQRDAQRQIRRVTAVTLGAAVLVVIMSALLVVARRAQAEAEHQRVEAEHRRADAEGLVDFMLTDLRTRLRAVGNLEIMGSVNERALKYFDDQGDPTKLDDGGLRLKSQVLQGLGEDEMRRGALAGAADQISRAYVSTRAILARHPKDPAALYAHAQSEFWMGLIVWQQKRDRSATMRHWQAYERLARELAMLEPGSVRSQLERGYSTGDLCELNLADDHDVDAALRDCAQSIVFERAALNAQKTVVARSDAARGPSERIAYRTMQADLANRLGWMARAQMAKHDPRAAIATRDAEATLMDEVLVADPRNADFNVRRSWSDSGKADAWLALNEPQKAVSLLRASLARHRAVFGDSNDLQFLETEFRLQLLLARALRGAGEKYAKTMARADQIETLLGAPGEAAKRRAEKIREGMWGKKESKGGKGRS